MSKQKYRDWYYTYRRLYRIMKMVLGLVLLALKIVDMFKDLFC